MSKPVIRYVVGNDSMSRAYYNLEAKLHDQIRLESKVFGFDSVSIQGLLDILVDDALKQFNCNRRIQDIVTNHTDNFPFVVRERGIILTFDSEEDLIHFIVAES